MAEIKVGDRMRFKSSGSDLQELTGQVVEVTKVIDQPDQFHDLEVLPMYRVMLVDESAGLAWLADCEVWADELEALDAS